MFLYLSSVIHYNCLLGCVQYTNTLEFKKKAVVTHEYYAIHLEPIVTVNDSGIMFLSVL